MESYNRVADGWKGAFHHPKKRLFLFLSVNNHLASEEPMTRVLTVGLTCIKGVIEIEIEIEMRERERRGCWY